MAQVVKNPSVIQKTWVRSLGWGDPLEKGMATHSSILAWRIPWTEEPGGLLSIESQRVGHDLVTNHIPFSGFKLGQINNFLSLHLHLFLISPATAPARQMLSTTSGLVPQSRMGFCSNKLLTFFICLSLPLNSSFKSERSPDHVSPVMRTKPVGGGGGWAQKLDL